jgi:hypothetical protein
MILLGIVSGFAAFLCLPKEQETRLLKGLGSILMRASPAALPLPYGYSFT